MLHATDGVPSTAQITIFEFVEMYHDWFLEGYTDIIMTLINSEGSATYQNAVFAIDSFFEEYPECKGKIDIHVHDGGNYTGAYGEPVLNAGKMVKEGASAQEINDYLEDILKHRRLYFALFTLKYASKSGRIPSSTAILGDTVGIKPIMKIWDHEITTAVKCRGEKKLISKIADMTLPEMVPGSEYQIVYGCDEAVRDEMVEKMTKLLGYGPTECYEIGAEVATSTGPKVVGTIFTCTDEWAKKEDAQ